MTRLPGAELAVPDRPARQWFRGRSVAVVGADGSGKTTVLDALRAAWPGSSRYIYMGACIDRANYSLPTSRWLTRRKRRVLAPLLGAAATLPPAAIMPAAMRERLPAGRWFKALGLVNRIAEEWFRQAVVELFKLRGFLVLCDRHFLFDYCPDAEPSSRAGETLSVRVHHWLLRRWYPRPDLVIFLDAPPEELFRRKPEWTLEHLRRQSDSIRQQGRAMPRFVRVDACLRPEQVLARIAHVIGARAPAPAGRPVTD